MNINLQVTFLFSRFNLGEIYKLLKYNMNIMFISLKPMFIVLCNFLDFFSKPKLKSIGSVFRGYFIAKIFEGGEVNYIEGN